MPQRQISVVISLPMIVQLGKTLLLLKRSADYALGVVYHVKQQHFNPHPTTRPGATSWMILYPLIPLCFNPHPTTRPGATLQGCPPPTKETLQWHFSPGAFSREFSPKRHDGEQRADDPLFPRGLFPGIFLGTANTSCPSRADVTR